MRGGKTLFFPKVSKSVHESDAVGRLAALGCAVVTSGTEPEITLAGLIEQANETTATVPLTFRIE